MRDASDSEKAAALHSRVVLLGGTGFIGSGLRAFLSGHHLVAPPRGEADVTDVGSLTRLFRPEDVVINAAGYAQATDFTRAGRARFQSVNVDGARNVARAGAEGRVAQLIHISSVAAMGRLVGEAITEEARGVLQSPYAASKRDAETALLEYGEALPITILRPTSIFGEGRPLAHALCRLASRRVVPLPGGGHARLPFAYIGNLCRCVELTLGNTKCFGRTFVVGDTEAYPLREIIGALARALGVTPRIVSVPYGAAYAAAKLAELLALLRQRPPLLDTGRLRTLTTTVTYSVSAFRAVTGYEPPFTLGAAAQRIASAYVAARSASGSPLR